MFLTSVQIEDVRRRPKLEIVKSLKVSNGLFDSAEIWCGGALWASIEIKAENDWWDWQPQVAILRYSSFSLELPSQS